MLPLSDMFQIGERLAVALADRFGFGLTVTLSPSAEGATLDLTSGEHTAQMLRAAIASGGRRRLVLAYGGVLPGGNIDENRYLADAPAGAWVRTAAGATVIHDDGAPLLSPAAPDAWIRSLAVPLGRSARLITAAVPVSLALSGGEYGIVGFDTLGRYLYDDPTVVAAAGDDGDPGTEDVYRYTARRRARMEAIVQDEILGAGTTWAEPRMQGLYSDSYNPERGRFNGWLAYTYPFEESRATVPPVSSVAMPEIYYNHVTNSGFGGMYGYEIDGQKLPSDIATHTLNDIGGGLETTGVGLFYGWLSAGWADTGIADRERWMGFTKVLCTLGMVGGITGSFTVDDAFITGHIRDGAVGTTMPSWLWQMTDLGHAIALFYHLEDFTRGGTLVAGSRLHPYRAPAYIPGYDAGLASKRLYALDLPAAETTAAGEPRAFVVACRHADGQRWILTAWCMQGPERDLPAQLPGVGTVVLRGRPAGSVYLLDRRGAAPELRLLDREAMDPTADLFPAGAVLAGSAIAREGSANTAPVIVAPAAANPAQVALP
ncbi:MAG: hypothetical protein RLZZ127_183 [Planctomycetota bacterium]|jgi:hypothetical protein